MDEKGLIIETDCFIAILFMLLVCFAATEKLSIIYEASEKENKTIELQLKAIAFMDSLIKNRNEKIPLNGMALKEESKKRIVSNSVDKELIEFGEEIELGAGIVVKELFIRAMEAGFEAEGNCLEKERTGFWAGNNCLVVERMVLVEGKKGILGGIVCRKDII